jgi:glyoxylase-like metal-dependent hydrolase (beta-lactamase superfamily II)
MFGENTYIAHLDGRKDCLIVDPGFDYENIIAELQTGGLTPAAILNTHGHADHIAGNAALKEQWPECPLVIGAGDAGKLTDAVENLSRPFGMDVLSPPPDQLVHHGEVFRAAGIELDVMELPGHSAGHVIFLFKASRPWIAFVGDVIFERGIGRTDFPDGNTQQLLDSIRDQLYTMPEDTHLLPGHGAPTTVGAERQGNPFVRG